MIAAPSATRTTLSHEDADTLRRAWRYMMTVHAAIDGAVPQDENELRAKGRVTANENLRGLVEEARGHLAQLALAFAIADGEGEARSVPEERTREDFNTALAGLAADLYCIVDDHCGGEVST